MGIVKRERGKNIKKGSVIFCYGERVVIGVKSKRPILKIEGYREKELGRMVYKEEEC